MLSSSFSFARVRPSLAAVLAVAACGGAVGAAGIGSASAAAATLPVAHVGVPLSAPAVSGAAWTWRRCLRYRGLVVADGASDLWELGAPDTVARDAIGSANAVSVGGAPLPRAADGALAGENEPASTFDGRGDALLANGAVATDGIAPYTSEAWVRPRVVDGTYRYVVSRESGAGASRQGTGVWLSTAGLGFERIVNGAVASVVDPAGLPVGRWSHVAASYDGTTMRLYVNGNLVGSRATTAALRPVTPAAPAARLAAATVPAEIATGPADLSRPASPASAGPAALATDLVVSTPAPLTLGAGDGGTTGFFAGDLDEVAAYDHAVDRSQVAAQAAAGAGAPCTVIPGATSAKYTPTTADLGDTLLATARTPASATTSTETAGPTDDGAGHVVHVTLNAPAANATLRGDVTVTASVSGLVPDRVEFVIDGVARYAKPGEAPYQYTWYTQAEPNGAHTVAVNVYGPSSTSPATAQAKVEVSNSTVHPTPLPFGKESMYAEFNEGSPATANNLLDDVWPSRGFALAKLDWPLTWTEDPYNDAYWRFFFYGLQPEATLLYEWEQTRDHAYLDKLIAILRSYVAYDRTRPANTLTFDNDHAAAYRTMELVNMYFKLLRDGELPADLQAGLQTSLAKLGTFLADPKHYEGGVNHGFNEGAALLVLADNFPTMAGAASWRTTAIDRLQSLLSTTIDSDGVEIENSPFYHVYVLGIVYQIAQWAKQYEPALAPSYTAAATKMLRFAADITQPSGYLPMLGATATTYMPSQDPTVYGPMAAADPAFDFAYTRGASGTPPPDGTVLFPASGLFIMRSPLVKPTNLPHQTYVTFDAGPYRTEHSDLDALGITMFSDQATVLPESGLFTYTQEPQRDFFHGTSAHNTVVVDHGDQAEGSAVAGAYGSGGGSTWATGTSDLYAGVHHARTVVVLRQDLTLVLDHLTSAASHTYTQTWHLDPAAVLSTSGQNALVRTAAGKDQMTITQANPAGETLVTPRGQTTPRLQGWYSSSYGREQPDYALEYTRTGTSASFATLIATGTYAAQTATVTTTALAGGATEADVCAGGTTGYRVTVPADANAQPTVVAGACAAGAATAR